MSGVEIPGNNEILPTGVQLIAQGKQMSVEIQFILHPFHPALTAREVCIEEAKSGMQGGNEASFDVEERCIHTQSKLQGWTPQKSRDPAVTGSFRRVPDHVIAGKVSLPILKLLRPDFDLLQTQDIGLLFPDPVQCTFPQCRA